MKLPRRKFLHLAAGAVTLQAVSRIARAQTYPTRPVRLIVGFTPGGPTDIFARLIGQWLSARFGQPFIIENRPGAGSTIGIEAVVNAPPDGYTLAVVSTSAAISASFYQHLNFNLIATSCRFRVSLACPSSWWLIHRFQPRRFLNSSPMRRLIPATSSWRRSAMALRRTWPASCSR